MATIKHSSEDRRSGRVGNTVYRNVRGKTIISSAPTCYRTPEDFESLLRFQKFSFLTSASKEMTRRPEIKCLWKRDDIPGIAPYHKFININYDQISPDYDLIEFHLAPPAKDFPVNITDITTAEYSIHIKTDPIGFEFGINPEREMYIRAVGFIICTHKNGNAVKGPIFYRKSELKKTSLETPYEFTLVKADVVEYGSEGYDGSKAVIIFITYNSEEQPVRWSRTIVKILTTSPNPVEAMQKFREEFRIKNNTL